MVEVVDSLTSLSEALVELSRYVAKRRVYTLLETLSKELGKDDPHFMDKLVSLSKSESFQEDLYDSIDAATKTKSAWGIRVIAYFASRIVEGKADIIDKLLAQKIKAITDEELEFLLRLETGQAESILSSDLLFMDLAYRQGFEEKFGVDADTFQFLISSLKDRYILSDTPLSATASIAGHGGKTNVTEITRRVLEAAKLMKDPGR